MASRRTFEAVYIQFISQSRSQCASRADHDHLLLHERKRTSLVSHVFDRHHSKVYHNVGMISFCLTVPGSDIVDP